MDIELVINDLKKMQDEHGVKKLIFVHDGKPLDLESITTGVGTYGDETVGAIQLNGELK